MPDYINSEYCQNINSERLLEKIINDDLIIEKIEGCKRGNIIAPFRLVKNLFKDDSKKMFKEHLKSARNDFDLSPYIVNIQQNKDRDCFCFAVNAVFLTPPAPVPAPESDPDEPGM